MKKHLPALLCCCLLAGCAQTRIVDRINIIQSIGVDVEGETYKISASYPTYIKTSQKPSLSPISAESNVIYGGFTALTAKSSQPVEIGQMRTLVISDEFAGKAISELAGIINRETIKSSNATLVLTKQSASSIIAATLKKPSFFLSELIEQNMVHGNTPITNYHSFVDQYYGEGQDVYLPVIGTDRGSLRLDGVGVFKGDELKLWLTNEEGLYLKLLADKALTGEYDFKVGPKGMYSFRILHGKRKITIAHNGNVTIALRLFLEFRELPNGMDVRNRRDLHEAQRQIEAEFAAAIKAMLVRFQKNGVDPAGFGERCRQQDRRYGEQAFYEKTYPNLNFDVKPKITILHAGVGH
ncbi:Ger(x)C family spore germination protein [Paenibacillus glycinis]|uniref:Ger(X)C family spore germination protein n=1 Tax=Paenibacillus glycinis TaxID=2697035 RepID=A0ABW9XNE5_9BACL|nr:Ger(x)C family spore germination protein [Paenibacillus glycinis]NBD24152.1 Ger(x)C family spore germination protein [Paenibacillus glycinis]